MKCPKCKNRALASMPALPDVGSPKVCTRCRGLWVEQSLYRNPAAQTISEEPIVTKPRTPRGRDLRTGLCPHGHGLLGRTRVGLEPRFYLDRCPHCGGIWFDRGEWDRIARARLLDSLPQLWTQSWRRRQQAAEARADHLTWARRRFGTELLGELQKLARRLEDSPVRSEALAFLREASRAWD